jgi:hypothetical protein
MAVARMIKMKQFRSPTPIRWVQFKFSFINFHHCWKGQARLLSGQYRPPAADSRALCHALQQKGVDISHVSMSKSYTLLAGIEDNTKTKPKARIQRGRAEFIPRGPI